MNAIELQRTKVHCPRGHQYDRRRGDGARACSICERARCRRKARLRTPEQRRGERARIAARHGRAYLSRAERHARTVLIREAERQLQPRKGPRGPRLDWSITAHYPGLTPKQARHKVANALAKGYLVKPDRCQRCNGVPARHRLHGHHHDYSYPLDVEWICGDCHAADHDHPC